MDASKAHVGEVRVLEEDTEDVINLSMCRIKPRRVKVALAPKVNRRKSKIVSCPCQIKCNKRAREAKVFFGLCSLSTTSTSGDEELTPSIPCHAIFGFLDPLLFGVLQVKYQNKPNSPFETHPVQMQTFLTAICIYSVVLGIKFHRKTRRGYLAHQILSYLLLFFGALSTASLLSILLQPLILWVLLVFVGFIAIIIGRHLLRSLFGRVPKLTWEGKWLQQLQNHNNHNIYPSNEVENI